MRKTGDKRRHARHFLFHVPSGNSKRLSWGNSGPSLKTYGVSIAEAGFRGTQSAGSRPGERCFTSDGSDPELGPLIAPIQVVVKPTVGVF